MYINARQVQLATSAIPNSFTSSGSAGGLRQGTAKNDVFHSIKNDVLSGGAGDDTYNLWDAGSKTLESVAQGIDTVFVRYWGGVAMADNVENAFLMSKGATWVKGNALDNIIVAGDTGARLNGGRGDDVLVGGKGADIFEVAAGNGSDAIVNFHPGWDVVKLDGFGIDSFGQLTAKARQTGSDVRIDLSASEILVLRDVRLDALHASDFGLPMTQAIANSGGTTLTRPGQAWNANGWYVVNNAWGAGKLTPGSDYTLSSTFAKADMTQGTSFNWSFPHVTTLGSTVLAYPEVVFGLNPLNPVRNNPTETAHVLPVRVGDIVRLTADYDVSFTGNTGGFNVSYDIWLTSTPDGGGRSAITNEIMVWVHAGDLPVPGTVIGTYIDGNFSAKIYHTGTYTAVVADRDVPVGTLDIADLLLKLQALGVVSSTEYVTAIELGAEVMSGQGSLTINDLELRVETRQAGGGTVVKTVTGAQTVVVTHSAAELAFEAEYASGAKAITDAFGHTVGTETTTRGAGGLATVTRRDAWGNVTESDVVSYDAGGITAKHLNGAGRYDGVTKMIYAADASVVTQRYDASGRFTGAEKAMPAAAGVVTTLTFDANWRMLGAEGVSAEPGGAIVTHHYDAAWGLTGADRLVRAGNVATTQHFDAGFVLVGADRVISNTDGSTAVQHYDASWKLVSADLIKVANGSTTTMHFDARYQMSGQEVVSVGMDGVTRTLAYDGSYKLTNTRYDGTDRADLMMGSSGATDFHGGAGSDRMTGGAGIDRFFLDALDKWDVDSIARFTVGKDKIMLDDAVFAGIGPEGTLAASRFAVGSRAINADTHLFFDPACGDLFYDADGNGTGAAILIAHVAASAPLSHSDFIIF